MHSGNAFTMKWVMEPKLQNVWGLPHAIWFFAMGVGGALYLMRFLLGIRLGAVWGLELADVLGVVLVGIGGLILISDLGRPLQFWRALRNIRASWIAVGAVADFVFLFAELLVLLTELEVGGAHPLGGLPWAPGTALGWILQILAAISALIVIIYPGLALAGSPAIPFWNNFLVPAQFLAFAFASACGLGFVLQALTGPAAGTLQRLALTGLVSVALTLFFVVGHVLSGYMQRGTARLSALLVLQGSLGILSWAALVAGLLLPAVLLSLALAQEPTALLGWLAVGGILLCLANLAFKHVVLKAGLYSPIL